MPTVLAQNAIASGVSILVLIAIPSWIGVYYFATHSREEISVAYGVPKAFLKRQWVMRTYLTSLALVGCVFGAVSVVLIAAGAGNGLAHHVLTLF